jgi:NAD-dependent SIR2 family protein deacetylase
MPKPPTLCPHGMLGKAKCSECKNEYYRSKKYQTKSRAEYQKAYYLSVLKPKRAKVLKEETQND